MPRPRLYYIGILVIFSLFWLLFKIGGEKPAVEIEQELRFLLSYIELQKERMNENYRVASKGFDEVSGLLIAPFLLVPIIENCFKHVSKWTDRENDICIECRR